MLILHDNYKVIIMNMIYDKQKMIGYSFTDMNGNTWKKQWVDCYNNLTNDINKSAGIVCNPNSLMDIEREFFLDQRHKNYVQFCELASEL